MDLVFLFVLPAALWVQSWYLLGFYTNPRTLGMVSAGVAIILLGVVLFQDQLPLAVEAPADLGELGFIQPSTAISGFILVWAVYAVLVAGVYLWGLESRSLGFYSLFLWVISILYAVYFFIGNRVLDLENIEVVGFSWLLGVVAILLAVLSGLLFFYLALLPAGRGEPPSSAMRTVTGWFYMVFSIAIAVLGGLWLLGLNPNL